MSDEVIEVEELEVIDSDAVVEDEFGDIDEDDIEGTGEDDDSEDSDDEYELDPDLANLKGIDIEWEERPVQARAARIRVTVPWEEKFDFLKEGEAIGKSLRIFSFTPDEVKKPEARAKGRAKEIRSRLFSTVPNESWTVSHRPWPDGSWRVYITFNAFLTEDETKARLAKYEERKKILEAAQAKSPLVQRGRERMAAEAAEAELQSAE